MDTMNTVIEVERKRELVDVTGLEERLAVNGYRAAGTSFEVDTYYSRPDIDFLATVECLRVRQRDGSAEITYKPASTPVTHSFDDIIAKPETNVLLAGGDQADNANALLILIGMVPLCRVAKTRTAFAHPGRGHVTVLIDLITGVGAFVETEVMAADRHAAAALLDQVERQLGLTDWPTVNRPYRDLVLDRVGVMASD